MRALNVDSFTAEITPKQKLCFLLFKLCLLESTATSCNKLNFLKIETRKVEQIQRDESSMKFNEVFSRFHNTSLVLVFV